MEQEVQIKSLRQQLVKEWLKQAYFRKDTQRNLELLNKELEDFVKNVNDQVSKEEQSLNEAISLTEANEFTPRFFPEALPVQFSAESFSESSYSASFQLLQTLKTAFSKVTETQEATLNQYKTYIEKINEEDKEDLKSLYEREVEKVSRLNRRLNGLESEVGELQKVLDEITDERDELAMKLENYEDKCVNCEELEFEIEDLKQEIEDLKQRNIYLSFQNEQTNTDLKKTQQSYDELKKNNEEIIQMSRKQESSTQVELKEMIQKVKEFQFEREEYINEFNQLKEQYCELESVNKELNEKLEANQNEAQNISKMLDEYEEEMEMKQQGLDKAKAIIKQLNEECEKLAKELSKSETEVENLKKTNKKLEKSYTDVRKQMNEVDNLKKTEGRLREELSHVKSKLSGVSYNKNSEVNDLNMTIEQLVGEKANLEGAMEELEERLGEIEKISKERFEMYTQSSMQIEELQQSLSEKDQEIHNLTKEYQVKEQNREAEVQHWKKQAENVIRQLHSLQTPEDNKTKEYVRSNRTPLRETKRKLPQKTDKENKPQEIKDLKNLTVSQSTVDNLAAQLEEALLRENKLKEQLQNLVEKEAQQIKQGLETLKNTQSTFRPETERWIMRNEELEQRVVGLENKNLELMGVVRDFRKTLHIKNVQLEEQKEIYDQNIELLQENLNLVSQELDSCFETFKTELMPNSIQVLNNSLSSAHEKIQSLVTESQTLRSELEQALIDRDKEIQTHQDTLKEFHQIKENLIKSENDLWHIEKQLNSDSQRHSTSSATFGNLEEEESPDFSATYHPKTSELSLTAQSIIDKINELKYSEHQLKLARQEASEFEEQRTNLIHKIENVKTEWNNQVAQLQTEATNYRDSLKTLQNENTYLKNRAEELSEYLKKHESEKEVLQEEFVTVHSDLRDTQAKLKQLEGIIDTDKTYTLKHNTETSKKLSDLENFIENQNQVIQNLQDEVEYLETAKSKLESALKQVDLDLEPSKFRNLQEEIQQLQTENLNLKETLMKHSKRSRRSCSHDKALTEKDQEITHLEKENQKLKEQLRNPELQAELELVKKKKENNKQSFRKRVREFELVLRYLEEKINQVTEAFSDPDLSPEDIPETISQITKRNTTLDSWIKVLSHKLNWHMQNISVQRLREVRTYSTICSFLSDTSHREDFESIYQQLKTNPDLDYIASVLLESLKNFLSSKKSHRKTSSYGGIGSVMIAKDHADLLISIGNKLQEAEAALKGRAQNLTQVSGKADQLVKTVNRLLDENSSSLDSEVLLKVLHMFQRFFKSFYSDIKSDKENLSWASDSLQQILKSSPDSDPNLALTLASYYFRTEAEMPKLPYYEAPQILHQLDHLNRQLSHS